MYKLVISDDEGKTTVVPLIRDEITIGRKEGNTIRLTERNVSRFHARVIRDEADGFIIEDLGSLCGTQVNAKILRSESAPITLGDNVSIGDYSLSIRSDVAADVPMGKQMDPGDQAGIGKVTPHARLVMISGPQPGREQDLTAELYVIGRSEEANFRIDHPSISRAHARIDLESGKWTISDLDSINGIFVNTFKKDDYVLKAGDIIRLGTVELRFVAPGEPYDFDPQAGFSESRTTIEPPLKKKSAFPMILGTLLVLAGAAAVAFLMWRQTDAGPGMPSVDEDPNSYDRYMEEGKDKIQNQAWAEAAKLFAMALQKRPDAEEARELKSHAIKEADAEAVYNQVLQAQENRSWKEAIEHYAKIPISSTYYNQGELKKISEKLCDELMETASFVQKTGTNAALNDVIGEIFEIPMAPKKCRGDKATLISRIEKAARSSKDGGILNGLDDSVIHKGKRRRESEEGGRPRNRRRMKKNPERIINPYAE